MQADRPTRRVEADGNVYEIEYWGDSWTILLNGSYLTPPFDGSLQECRREVARRISGKVDVLSFSELPPEVQANIADPNA